MKLIKKIVLSALIFCGVFLNCKALPLDEFFTMLSNCPTESREKVIKNYFQKTNHSLPENMLPLRYAVYYKGKTLIILGNKNYVTFDPIDPTLLCDYLAPVFSHLFKISFEDPINPIYVQSKERTDLSYVLLKLN